MLHSTNRHVGRDLQAELDDARAEIRDLRAENAALQRSLNEQRVHYEKEIAYLKQVGRMLNDAIAKAHPEYVNQQVAQTNPYAIA